MSEIKDISLAPEGEHKIDWVRKNCPLLRSLEEEFSQSLPFKGIRVALSIHLEAKTASLCKVLAAGGAEMYVTGSNPLSTQDDVAAALAAAGLNVFAWYNSTPEEYEHHIAKVLENNCNIIIDDGGDLVHMLHTATDTELKCKYNIYTVNRPKWPAIFRFSFAARGSRSPTSFYFLTYHKTIYFGDAPKKSIFRLS